MFKNYFRIDENNIVIATICTKKEPSSDDIPFNAETNPDIMGKRWNGKNFEEVPKEELEEPETTEVTNEDLLEVLLAIGEKVGA